MWISQPLDYATFQAIHDAWMKHQVIFFRDQHLTVAQPRSWLTSVPELAYFMLDVLEVLGLVRQHRAGQCSGG